MKPKIKSPELIRTDKKVAHEDSSVTLVLEFVALEILPEGRRLALRCDSLLSFTTLPLKLFIAEAQLRRDGWDPAGKIAYYVETKSDVGR